MRKVKQFTLFLSRFCMSKCINVITFEAMIILVMVLYHAAAQDTSRFIETGRKTYTYNFMQVPILSNMLHHFPSRVLNFRQHICICNHKLKKT